jgi:hypothetical protein
MEVMIIGLLVILIGALLRPEQRPSLPSPTVIYVEREPAPVDDGLGCLPVLVLLGLLVAVLLSIGI